MLYFRTSRRGHGSAYDRGAADAWYGRPSNPHAKLFLEGKCLASRVPVSGVPTLLAEYRQGYRDNLPYFGDGLE